MFRPTAAPAITPPFSKISSSPRSIRRWTSPRETAHSAALLGNRRRPGRRAMTEHGSTQPSGVNKPLINSKIAPPLSRRFSAAYRFSTAACSECLDEPAFDDAGKKARLLPTEIRLDGFSSEPSKQKQRAKLPNRLFFGKTRFDRNLSRSTFRKPTATAPVRNK